MTASSGNPSTKINIVGSPCAAAAGAGQAHSPGTSGYSAIRARESRDLRAVRVNRFASAGCGRSREPIPWPAPVGRRLYSATGRIGAQRDHDPRLKAARIVYCRGEDRARRRQAAPEGDPASGKVVAGEDDATQAQPQVLSTRLTRVHAWLRGWPRSRPGPEVAGCESARRLLLGTAVHRSLPLDSPGSANSKRFRRRTPGPQPARPVAVDDRLHHEGDRQRPARSHGRHPSTATPTSVRSIREARGGRFILGQGAYAVKWLSFPASRKPRPAGR